MRQREYLDFELCIEQEGQQYQANVVRSPTGEASQIFSLPFSDLELENFVLRLGVSRRGTRRISSAEMESSRQFGGRLFESVFRGDVRASFVSSQHEARRQGRGLRLKLRLEAPELFNVPWEYLYDSSLGRFLSLFEDTPIVRYLDVPRQMPPLAVDPPLSVLAMLSSPTDHPRLNVEGEKASLQQAVQALVDAGLLRVAWLEAATLPALADALLHRQYHILHFVGHGGFDERAQDGVLVLEGPNRQGRLVSGERLAVLLGNHPTMRLAFLNACEGARTSREDPFAGTATSLVRTGGVPAVVAMQFAISDEAAILFAEGFYAALSVGRPVDAAVTQARLSIFASGNDVEWGKPVLYMRAPDGRIFDVAALSAEAPVASQRVSTAPSPDERREALLANLYQQASARLAERDWHKANTLLLELTELAPAYRDAQALLDQSKAGLQQQEAERLRQDAAARLARAQEAEAVQEAAREQERLAERRSQAPAAPPRPTTLPEEIRRQGKPSDLPR